MEEIEADYKEFLDKIAQKYKGRTFYYNPPVSSEDANLTLIGRNGLKLEFLDARGNFDYLSIEDFLQLSQTPARPEGAESPIIDLQAAREAKEKQDRKQIYNDIIKLADHHLPVK